MKSFGNIAKDGQVRAVASGALTDGSTVIVNSDGTVSVVTETPISQAVGTPVQFTSQTAMHPMVAFDSVNNKVVVVFRGSSNYGQARVGTVSGNSISFGSTTTFNSAYTNDIDIVFDSNAEKFVIAYRDHGNSQYGTAIVGTVSGTSISFGSEAVFTSTRAELIGISFDSSSNKVVIGFQDVGNSNYGTAVVGTVSGTSISFGSKVVYQSAYTIPNFPIYDSANDKTIILYGDNTTPAKPAAIVGTVSGTSISFGSEATGENVDASSGISAAYDTANNQIVVAYADNTNTRGRVVLLTVSGTSVSFGTPVTFDEDYIYDPRIVYDSTNNKIVIAYKALDNSNYGTAIVGTISGSSITFGAEVTLTSNSIEGNPIIGGTFDSANGKVVFVYRHTSGGTGKAVVFQNTSASTNLTSENFIGFSDGVFADTESASINTTNTIDRNQSSLTAGQTYFVQTDGTLSETADDPSVTAGTAISATELIVKG